MATSDLDQLELPGVSFTQRERRGVLLGRSGAQLVIAGTVITVLILSNLMFTWSVTGWLLLPGLPLVVFALWTFRGEPVTALASRALKFRKRAKAGQTQYRRQIGKEPAATQLPFGRAPERIAEPVVLRTLRLPGGLADVQYIDIPGAGGFLYNAKDKLASFTVRVDAPAWALRDDNQKLHVYNGFAGWLSSLEGVAGLLEAELRVRVDRAPSTELTDYAARQDAAHQPQISEELRSTYDWLVATHQARSMEFTNTITITIDTRTIASDIHDSGGGLSGLAAIIFDQVTTVQTELDTIGVTFAGWMTADELEAYILGALDPVATSARRERLGRGRDEEQTRSPIMAIDEQWSSVRVNESEHRTLWLHEWPRTEVKVGFLHPLLYSGEATRCVVIKFRPIPLHKALNDVVSAQSDMDAADNLREKLGTRSNVFNRREREDIEEREEDLADGFTDGRFRAFVTISAATVTDVRRDQTSLQGAGFQSNVRMGVMFAQQWAALIGAVLPIPVRDRKAN